MRSPVGTDLRAGLGAVFGGASEGRAVAGHEVERPARIARHDWRRAAVDLRAFAQSGVGQEAMGRTPAEDPLFFGAALAAGGVLAELTADAEDDRGRGAA
jgi:hypothetical protein